MLDVDYFKRINDTYGHALGDQVLRTVGNLMRSATRASDAAGRIGGEEFLRVLPGSTTLDAAQVVAERLRSAVAASRPSARPSRRRTPPRDGAEVRAAYRASPPLSGSR